MPHWHTHEIKLSAYPDLISIRWWMFISHSTCLTDVNNKQIRSLSSHGVRLLHRLACVPKWVIVSERQKETDREEHANKHWWEGNVLERKLKFNDDDRENWPAHVGSICQDRCCKSSFYCAFFFFLSYSGTICNHLELVCFLHLFIFCFASVWTLVSPFSNLVSNLAFELHVSSSIKVLATSGTERDRGWVRKRSGYIKDWGKRRLEPCLS